MAFAAKKAFRENTPLLIGLVSPSGGGKTMSALRMARGIQRVRGGNIIGIDTEGNRMLHYSPRNGEEPDFKDSFDFIHMPFTEPFSSLRYAEAIRDAVKLSDGGIIIIDSMSHEHDGIGGYLFFHDAECERLSRGENKTSESVSWRAFAKPAAARRVLINTITQFNIAMIFCFKAKEKSTLFKDQDGKNKVISIGYQALAGDEFVFEMTIRCLLPPGSEGVADWSPDAFKNGVAKCPGQLKPIMINRRQLDEQHGEELAMWAAGKSSAKSDAKSPSTPSSRPGPTEKSKSAEKVSPEPPQKAASSNNGHASYPHDWPKKNDSIKAKGDVSYQGISNKTLGEQIAGKDAEQKKYATWEGLYRLERAQKKFKSSGAFDKFCEIVESADGDIAKIDASFIAEKLDALTKAAMKLK